MNKVSLFFLLISFGLPVLADTEGDGSTQEASQITPQQFFEMTESFSEKTGACVYREGLTFVCSDDVTKSWCDSRPNSDFGEGDTCP